MATAIQYGPDRLIAPVTDEITWESARKFVAEINAGLDQYYYQRIEVIVHSSGGRIDALEHMVKAFARWHDREVHVCTRVDASAASAAAVLFSLGDERVAEPGAMLLYHFSRVTDPGPITADASARLSSDLARVDERIVGYLVDRALKGRAVVPHQAETSDLEVLKRVIAAILPRRRPRGKQRARQLAEWLGGALDDAVRARDRKTLSRAYRELARLDRPISASLAQTLRLVDQIGDTRHVPEPRSDVQVGLTIPEWRVLYPPLGEVPRSVLTRHALVLGETGSGKSASVVLPLLMALVRAPQEHFGGALVIDPKYELLELLERVAPERLQHVTAENIALNLMVGNERCEADLAAQRWSMAASRILRRAASFARSSPLRVLGPHETGAGNTEFFDQEGSYLLCDLLAFILMLTTGDAPPPEKWIDERDVESREWVEELYSRARGHDGERGLNALALCSWAISGSPVAASYGDEINYPWLFARLAQHAMQVWGAKPGEGRELLHRVCEHWWRMAKIDKQHGGTVATARNACAEFAEPLAARTLYFGCEPGWRDARSRTVDFASLASRDADGSFVLYQPERGTESVLVARVLKALFFEAVLADPARIDNGGRMPLVGYIADEFQQFVTSDAVHGEQSFLDRCRSFGAFCLLASQGTSSIRYALSEGGGNPTANEMAFEMLLINTGTKYFFRSTDPQTVRRVEVLCPQRPGLSPVTAVRPLNTLTEGECYVALADGRFDRKQLAPVIVDEPRNRPRVPDAPTSHEKSEVVDDRGGGHAMDAVSARPAELLSEALAMARHIWDADHHSQAFRTIVETHYAIAKAQAPAGATGGATNMLTEALDSARRIEDTHRRASVLCAIAGVQAPAGTAGSATSILAEALASARRIEDATIRARTLCTIAEAQEAVGTAGGVANVLTEALFSARRIEDVDRRVWIHGTIAEAQAATGDIEGASATARRIEDAVRRASVLRDIAGAQAVAGDIEGASATARSIESETFRSWAHWDIAEAQVAAGDIEGAVDRARRIEVTHLRDQALVAIAGAQAAARDIEGACATARIIETPGWRDRALGVIAEAQAAAGDIEGALVRALCIETPGWRDRALVAIAGLQAKADDIEGARDSARRIVAAEFSAEALVAIARAQAVGGDITGACESARSITVVIDRAIKDLVPPDEYPYAVGFHELEDALSGWPGLAFCAIAKVQLAAGDIEGALSSARSIGNAVHIRAEALVAIAKTQAAGGDVEGAFATAESIMDLVQLFPYSPNEITTEKDALSTQRDQGFCAIAEAQAAAGHIESAAATARSIKDPYIRVQALCAAALTNPSGEDRGT